jgi:hypothetical protein
MRIDMKDHDVFMKTDPEILIRLRRIENIIVAHICTQFGMEPEQVLKQASEAWPLDRSCSDEFDPK